MEQINGHGYASIIRLYNGMDRKRDVIVQYFIVAD